MRRAVTSPSIVALIASLAAIGTLRAEIVREIAEPILRLDLPGHTSEVRALAFFPGSSRLVSGGRDKVAMVWNPDTRRGEAAGPLTRDIGRRRTRERVLRWQAARGTRGAIQAVAVSTGERPIVAIGGSGAMGSTGELLLFDGRDGTLSSVLGGGEKPGHRNSVLAVDFSVGGDWLFSQDFDGQAYAWKRDDGWRPIELAAREDLRYGPVRTAAVQTRPRMRPLAAIAGGRVALPVLMSPEGAAKEVWRIELVDPAAPAARSVLPTDHLGVVMAMDASPDGRFLASADLAGRVHVHDLAALAVKPASFRVAPAVESIAVSPDGATVAIGVAAGAAGTSAPRIELWNAGSAGRIFTREMPSPVRAVAISDDGKLACWSGGWRHEVFVEPISNLVADAKVRGRLGGVGRRIGRVAFERQEDGRAAPRRIAVSWEPPPGTGDGVAAAFEAAFDLESLALADPPAADRLAPPEGRRRNWTIARAAKQPAGIESWQLIREGRPAGRIDLDIDWQGRMGPAERCVAWLEAAVAIGTDRGIFVYSLGGDGNADEPRPIVRRYRGHEDGVTAVCVSEDGRWLASGGRDGIVMIWPIAGLDGGPLFERFGIGLEVGTGRAVVSRVDEAGPLAGRDVAVGDVLAKVSAPAEGPERPAVEAVAGGAVAAALTNGAWMSQWSFVVERDGRADEPFHRQPAWENIAAFHLADNREWAYWSPRGYYAASANGDGLFGWLVNRGLDRLPRFHPARQFRRRLERPDVMSRLLADGSLAAALVGGREPGGASGRRAVQPGGRDRHRLLAGHDQLRGGAGGQQPGHAGVRLVRQHRQLLPHLAREHVHPRQQRGHRRSGPGRQPHLSILFESRTHRRFQRRIPIGQLAALRHEVRA
jgi:WD40 repeat protein